MLEGNILQDSELVEFAGRVAFLKALKTNPAEILLSWGAIGSVKLRVFFRTGRIEFELDVTLLSDLQRGIAGTGKIHEETAHLLCCFKVVIRWITFSVLINEQPPLPDANKDILRLRILLI